MRAGGADADGAGEPRGQFRERRDRDEPPLLMMMTWSTVCATSASTWLETRTVLPSAAKLAQEVAQPADALRIEPVRGLVEDQQLGVAEQRSSKSEPLPHPERIAADTAATGAG